MGEILDEKQPYLAPNGFDIVSHRTLLVLFVAGRAINARQALVVTILAGLDAVITQSN